MTDAALDQAVRLHVFGEAAATGQGPQAPALDRPQGDVFCAVPSHFRVKAQGRTYWGICIAEAPRHRRSDPAENNGARGTELTTFVSRANRTPAPHQLCPLDTLWFRLHDLRNDLAIAARTRFAGRSRRQRGDCRACHGHA